VVIGADRLNKHIGGLIQGLNGQFKDQDARAMVARQVAPNLARKILDSELLITLKPALYSGSLILLQSCILLVNNLVSEAVVNLEKLIAMGLVQSILIAITQLRLPTDLKFLGQLFEFLNQCSLKPEGKELCEQSGMLRTLLAVFLDARFASALAYENLDFEVLYLVKLTRYLQNHDSAKAAFAIELQRLFAQQASFYATFREASKAAGDLT